MNIKDLLNQLDKIAPFSLQMSNDNSGVQFADLEGDAVKILLAVDLTEEVLDEAIKNDVKLPVSLEEQVAVMKTIESVYKQNEVSNCLE